jgi:bacteriochlorophyll 4-vinyl reductase
MSEPRIGRYLVASLHQAIAELLPDRLEFYENWLSVAGLREGTIGLAPFHAVLSFLRVEGELYPQVVAKAGEYAAQWTVNGLPGLERRVLRTLPLRLRTRAALRTARVLIRTTYPGSRAIMRIHKETASIDLRGSLFCEVRAASVRPLCGFYAAAIVRVLHLFAVPADARVDACRASGGGGGCLMSIVVREAPASETAAA